MHNHQTKQFRIFYRNSQGKGNRIQISENSTINDLVEQIERNIKKRQNQFKLFYLGKELKPSNKSINEFNIQQNSIIHVAQYDKSQLSNKVNIKIRIFDNNYHQQFLSAQYISVVVNKIASDLNLEPQYLCLSHLGKILNLSKTLQQQNIIGQVWISVNYFPQKNTVKEFKIAQSIQLPRQNKQSYEQIKQPQPFDQIIYKSTVSMVESENQSNLRVSEKSCRSQISKWKGTCVMNIFDEDNIKNYTIQCQYNYPIKQFIGKIAKLQDVKQETIQLYNPNQKSKINLQQIKTVIEIPWNGKISHKKYYNEILFEIV